MTIPTIRFVMLSLFAFRSCRRTSCQLAIRRFLRDCLLLFGMSLLCGGLVHSAALKEGDILVVDEFANKLFKVDAENGARTVISDFSDASQGPTTEPWGLAGVAVGRRQIFVTRMYMGIFGVDPSNGKRTLLSNFNQGAIQGSFGYGAAVDVDEQVIANLQTLVESPLWQYVVRVDPRTDARVIVSDFTNFAQGEILNPASWMTDLTLDRSGAIVAGMTSGYSYPFGSALYRIDQKTGNRRLVSDFINPAQGIATADLEFATGVAVESSGQILVNTAGISFISNRILLLRVDPETGMRTVLSDFGDAAQGPTGVSLHGLAVERSGKIIVSSATATWVPNLYRVNPRTGRRTMLSDSSDSTQGEPFQRIVEIAVVRGEHEHHDGHHGHEGHSGFGDPEKPGSHAQPRGDWLISPFAPVR